MTHGDPETAALGTGNTLRTTGLVVAVSAVNTIGAQSRGLINRGLTRWRLTIYMDVVAETTRNPVSMSKIQAERGESIGLRGAVQPNLSRENKFSGVNGEERILFALFSWPRAGSATLPGGSAISGDNVHTHIQHFAQNNLENLTPSTLGGKNDELYNRRRWQL